MTPTTTLSSSAWEKALGCYDSEQEFLNIIKLCGEIGTIICDVDFLAGFIPATVENGVVEILSKKVLDNPNAYFVCIE